MNTRERYLAVMNFEPVDQAPFWEFGYWGGTMRRWYREGLPWQSGVPDDMSDGDIARGEALWWDEEKPPEKDVHGFLGHDPGMRHVPLNNFLCPKFAPEILEDHGESIVARDEWGMVESRRKDGTTLPHFLRGPVQCREDWEELKTERLRPTLEGRLPENWSVLKEEYKRRDYPLAVGGGQGFFGSARRLLGDMEALLCFHDQPELVCDIMTYLAEFWCAIYDQALAETDVDVVLIWEDMCYKNGPLISPEHFREFLLDPYKKLRFSPDFAGEKRPPYGGS